jgi:hypothetical protein
MIRMWINAGFLANIHHRDDSRGEELTESASTQKTLYDTAFLENMLVHFHETMLKNA